MPIEHGEVIRKLVKWHTAISCAVQHCGMHTQGWIQTSGVRVYSGHSISKRKTALGKQSVQSAVFKIWLLDSNIQIVSLTCLLTRFIDMINVNYNLLKNSQAVKKFCGLKKPG